MTLASVRPALFGGTTVSANARNTATQSPRAASWLARHWIRRPSSLRACAAEWITRRRTRSGCSAARCKAMDPPVDTPITSAGPLRSSRIAVA